MSAKSFKGGIHPNYSKVFTAGLPVKTARLPEKVIIPLQQHIGAPCDPLVEEGQSVKRGQKIAASESFVSAPIHASISGTVASIGSHYAPTGTRINSVVIESDGSDALDESVQPSGKTLEELSAQEIIEIIREAGIVGMGGAAFPAHVKLSPPEGKEIDTVIINGAECEPYLTADHRIMLEEPERVVTGLKAFMKALGAPTGIIGIEDNKPDALESMREAIKSERGMSVFPLPTKYPQGAEKMLIEVITGRQVPSGGLPLDVGVVNHNVGTSASVARAIEEGMPLVERVITVTGRGVLEPSNLKVRVGTPFADIVEQCGGVIGDVGKVVAGGPMMGIAQPNLDVPVVKGTSGILILKSEDVELAEPGPCIKCARCVEACPINLMPLFLGTAGEKRAIDLAEEYNALDCIECGCCSYECPAVRPLTQWIKAAKAEIMARKKKQG